MNIYIHTTAKAHSRLGAQKCFFFSRTPTAVSALRFFIAPRLGPYPKICSMTQSTDGCNLKSHSCLTCRKRKVKCDRRAPCCNCVKADKQCSFIPPARGKRKRTKPPREGLHVKLERYEKLLSLRGIKSEPSDDLDASHSETDAWRDEDANAVVTTIEEPKPKLIIREGISRYFDRCVCVFLLPSFIASDICSAPWSIFGGESKHSARILLVTSQACLMASSFNIQKSVGLWMNLLATKVGCSSYRMRKSKISQASTRLFSNCRS